MPTEHLRFPSSVVIMDVDIMSNEPVMWTTLRGKEGLFPLYTHPPDDTALLRQALEALEFESSGYCGGEQTEKALTALKERLGEKT